MKYDLVFEGGGAKGMVFVGACEELFKRGHTFDRLIGTSAGGITATLLAAGYTPDEMLEALTEKEQGKSVFAGFMGPPPPFTDQEIQAGAFRRFLAAVDFKFIPDWLEKGFDDKPWRFMPTCCRVCRSSRKPCARLLPRAFQRQPTWPTTW